MKKIDEFLDMINDIVHYAQSKTLYEVECQVFEELKNLRRADFESKLSKHLQLTKELALTKNKLDRLKKRTETLPKEYSTIILPLISQLDEKVERLRKERK